MTELDSLNQTTLAAVLGLSTRALRKLHGGTDGIPHFKRGKEVRYPIPQSVEWYFRGKFGDAETASAKARLIAAQAALKEHQVEVIRGEWIHIDDLERLHAEPLAHVRARLLALPGRIAPELPIPAVDAVEIIEAVVHQFMAELSESEEVPADA